MDDFTMNVGQAVVSALESEGRFFVVEATIMHQLGLDHEKTTFRF